MRTFPCRCQNTLFFDSTVCLKCGLDTAMCPACNRVAPLILQEGGDSRCGHPDCEAALRACGNRAESVCNRGLLDTGSPGERLCDLCRLTTLIPDLSVLGNRDKWRRLEQAKRRVLYVLDLIDLAFRPGAAAGGPWLSFEFKSDGPRPARTGHEDGRITINLREADHVEREKARVEFDEPQRTLVGHLRHELGHFFWDRLVKWQREDEFRSLFGDERNPSYGDALRTYHERGLGGNWRSSYISAYATMHPWEDFAETFGAYLDMVSVLDTANHFAVAPCELDAVDRMIESYQRVGLIANEFNRDMGLLDLVPEVFVPAVIEKLRFIHALPRGA